MHVYILEKPGKAREQIVRWLKEHPGIIDIKVFTDHLQFLEEINKSPPHLSLIRLGNNGIPGLKTAEMVKAKKLGVKIVFLAEERDYALDAFEIGVDGYLLCPVEKRKLKKYL